MLCSGIQVYGLLNYFVLCATDRDSKNCRQDEPHPYCSILSAALAGSSGERLSSNFVLFGQCGDVIGKRIITRCLKKGQRLKTLHFFFAILTDNCSSRTRMEKSIGTWLSNFVASCTRPLETVTFTGTPSMMSLLFAGARFFLSTDTIRPLNLAKSCW